MEQNTTSQNTPQGPATSKALGAVALAAVLVAVGAFAYYKQSEEARIANTQNSNTVVTETPQETTSGKLPDDNTKLGVKNDDDDDEDQDDDEASAPSSATAVSGGSAPAPVSTPAPTPTPAPAPVTAPKTAYKNGTYTTKVSYASPGGTNDLTVTLGVADDAVTSVSIVNGAHDSASKRYIDRFSSGISAAVVGQKLSTLSVDTVSGASLTSAGFNKALDTVRVDAKNS